MSYATTHGLHVHVPWTPILAALITAVIAGVVIYAINQNTSSTTHTPSVIVPAAGVIVPKPETVIERRALLAAPAVPRVSAVMKAYAPAHVPAFALDRTETYAPASVTAFTTPLTPGHPTSPYWRIEFPAGT